MKYLSVCSGIEAATVAWHGLGWQPVGFCEFDTFPSAVLAHHYPDTPNLGDLTKWREWPFDVFANADILVGGTPCQAFSVAGLRRSLDDERGNLSLIYVELANEIDSLRRLVGLPPAVIVWENVPGVLSTKDNAFGCFLAGLAGEDVPLEPAGGKWTDAGCVLGPERAVAWRILDAQYFGLAQRRRRVFVVASSRDGFDPAAVLFEFEGVRRDSAPSREAREGTAAGTLRSTLGGSDVDHARAGQLLGSGVTHALRADGFDASEDGTGRGTPLTTVCMAHGQANAEIRTDGGAGPMGNRERACLSSAYEFGLRRGFVATNPCRGIRRNRERPSKVYVGHEELAGLIDRAPAYWQPFLQAVYLTGWRVGDLIKLERSALGPDGIRIVESKNNVEHFKEWSPTLRAAVQAAIEHGDAQAEVRKRPAPQRVFTGRYGQPLTYWAVSSQMARLGRPFELRQVRAKAETDRRGTLGHGPQMARRYTRSVRTRPVK